MTSLSTPARVALGASVVAGTLAVGIVIWTEDRVASCREGIGASADWCGLTWLASDVVLAIIGIVWVVVIVATVVADHRGRPPRDP